MSNIPFVYADESNSKDIENKSEPAQQQFELLELRVKGNTQLDKLSIERTVYPFLGKQKSIDNVEKARTALENLYHNKGYQTVSVDIPEQNVVNGVVYLQVNEGSISRLRVTDSKYFSLGNIKAKVPELAEGNVPNMPKMQEQLAALAKESPDRSITPILRAGETPGTLEVDLKVNDELPLHGKLELNGRNTTNTDRLRAIASFHYDNLWQKFHSASFMFQTTPEDTNQVEVVVGSYALPIFDSDKRLAFFVISSNSNSVVNAGNTTVIGTGNIYGMRYVNPISINIKNYFQTFTAGVTYKDNMQNSLDKNSTQSTPYSYIPFTVGYNGTLQNPESILTFNINTNFSIRGLGNINNQFTNGTRPDFAYLNGGISFNHNLPHGLEFATRFNGQIANSTLVPYERFSIGGQQSVRGYYETQLLTDDGMYGSLELYSPKLNIDGWPEYNKLRGLVFVDAGAGWVTNPDPNSKSNPVGLLTTESNLASAGTGFRMQLWKKLTANFDIAVPFVSQTRAERGNPRIHFQIFTEF